MNETLILALAGIAGSALGAFFFVGLWWTVRQAMASRQPALWCFCALVLRMSVALAGFYVVAGGAWQRLVACLCGFLIARSVVLRLTRPDRENRTQAVVEASRAP